jgi:hypothetical protein
VTDQELTALQQAILDVEALNLPLREAMRLVTFRVGFFVGQQRYVGELKRARAIIGADSADLVETDA